MKNLGEYHYFYLKSHTSLLADVFENILKNILRDLRIRSGKISFSSRIIVASNFKQIKLGLLTDIDMLLMVEKGIRGGFCQSIKRYTKTSNKYMKDYDKNKESSYFKCWDVNKLGNVTKIGCK